MFKVQEIVNCLSHGLHKKFESEQMEAFYIKMEHLNILKLKLVTN